MPWTEKHRPKSFDEIKGQNIAIAKTKEFIEKFHLGMLTKKGKKALILHGPPGTGKTTLAITAANETNSEIFELNASDLRNKAKLHEILKPAIEQQSLMKKTKIILIDEVDGISAVDRGGLLELLQLIEITTYPLIITANDIWKRNLNSLRKKAEIIELKEIDYKTIKEVLFNILRKENLFINNNIITSIAIRAKGDLRAAINDLQTITRLKDPSEIEFHERDKKTDIFSVLKQIFEGKPSRRTAQAFDSINMPLDEIMLWVEKNIPIQYKGEELARAYDLLSKADVFKGRIYKQQYWRFLVYQNILLSYGISSAKKQIKTDFVTYKKPTRILKIWMNNQKTTKKKTIAQKYAKYSHMGQKKALSEFPIIKQVINSNPEIQKELKLNDEEIEYLML
jgi:replication factor C large subunit